MIFLFFYTPPMHCARIWGSGRLENHLKTMVNLFENHVEKELRFDVIFFAILASF